MTIAAKSFANSILQHNLCISVFISSPVSWVLKVLLTGIIPSLKARACWTSSAVGSNGVREGLWSEYKLFWLQLSRFISVPTSGTSIIGHLTREWCEHLWFDIVDWTIVKDLYQKHQHFIASPDKGSDVSTPWMKSQTRTLMKLEDSSYDLGDFLRVLPRPSDGVGSRDLGHLTQGKQVSVVRCARAKSEAYPVCYQAMRQC